MTWPAVRGTLRVVKNLHDILLAPFHYLVIPSAVEECLTVVVFRSARVRATFLFAVVASSADGEIFSSSIVSAGATMPVQHGSSIVELDDGSFLVSWYAGTTEAARDSRILLRHSTSGCATWEPTQIAVNPHERAAESWFSSKAVGNTVLFQDENKFVWLFYAAIEFGGWSGAHVDYKISADRGRTWSTSRRLTSGQGDIPRGKPIELSDHEIFLPLSHSALRKYPLGARLEIANGKIVRKMYSKIADSQFSHPAFLTLDSNRVLAFLRARGGGTLQTSFFDVAKNTWSNPQKTNVPNPDSAIDALRLENGAIVLVYNDSPTARNPLSIAVANASAEVPLPGEITFRKLRDIENELGQGFSYPSLVRAHDGTFYLTYTWHDRAAIKCVHFDSNWLGLGSGSVGQ
jgi:predicted neuraminidase